MTWWWGRRRGCYNASVVVEAFFSAEPHRSLQRKRSSVFYCKSCWDLNGAVWCGDGPVSDDRLVLLPRFSFIKKQYIQDFCNVENRSEKQTNTLNRVHLDNWINTKTSVLFYIQKCCFPLARELAHSGKSGNFPALVHHYKPDRNMVAGKI